MLECGILVIGLLRSFLFDVCVKCGVGVSEAVFGCFLHMLRVVAMMKNGKIRIWRDHPLISHSASFRDGSHTNLRFDFQ